MTHLVTCECGDAIPAEEVTVDIGGCNLCPACAIESDVACGICGTQFVPVRIYTSDGQPASDEDRAMWLFFGPPANYFAVCEACDTSEEGCES